jgi:hypothetical protein
MSVPTAISQIIPLKARTDGAFEGLLANNGGDATAWVGIQDSSLQVAYRKMRFDV